MLSWYNNFLIDLNAANQLPSFNMWWLKFPQCWVSFDGLTPEGYWRPGSKSPWLMMNLTKFTWSCLCCPAIGSKLVKSYYSNACQQLTLELDVCWNIAFSGHMSVTEWLLTWYLENKKVSFVKSFFHYIFKSSNSKFQFDSNL